MTLFRPVLKHIVYFKDTININVNDDIKVLKFKHLLRY